MSSVSKPFNVACVLSTPGFKPGDPAPSDYLGWHEWAEVQHKAGLRQVTCGHCGKWRFPQELSTETVTSKYRVVTKKGLEDFVEQLPVCLGCAKKEPS